MPQAFLIIAHNEYELLRRLVSLLDHPESHIYIHIDKKSELPKDITAKYARLFFLEERLDVRWGDKSQIEVEYLLFKTAFKNGPYLYYHLLSGVDLPIKPISKILDYFESNKGYEFVSVNSIAEHGEHDWANRVLKFHFLTRHFRANHRTFVRKGIGYVRFVSEVVVNKLIKRKPLRLGFGTNWVSITNDFCEYLLAAEPRVMKRFRFTALADEIFLHTVLINSPFKDKLYKGEKGYCAREMDWQRGCPYVWGGGAEQLDIQTLRQSPCMFARKFSYNQYPAFVDKVCELAKEK